MPVFSPDRLVLATQNAGKLREFGKLLGGYFGTIVTVGELGLPEPEETGVTFTENALIKVKAAAEATNSHALADDSGLCVSALGGDPGLFSARWAGPNKDFGHAMRRVQDALGDATDRSAHFIAVLALALPNGATEIFEGRVDGHIVWPPRGDKGHGYDPIFIPTGETRTFAEIGEDAKNALSHRGRAVRKLLAWLETHAAR